MYLVTSDHQLKKGISSMGNFCEHNCISWTQCAKTSKEKKSTKIWRKMCAKTGKEKKTGKIYDS